MKQIRVISIILTLLLVISSLPSIALADGDTSELRTFLSSSGRIGIIPSFSSAGVSEWSILSDGTGKERLHLYRADTQTSTGAYFEVSPRLIDKVKNYVYEIDIYPETLTTHQYIDASLNSLVTPFHAIDNNNNYMGFVTLYGNRLCLASDKSTILATIDEDKWTTLSLAVDLENKIFDVYINKNKVNTNGISFEKSVVPQIIRVLINTGYKETNVYFDNIKLYEGNKPRDVEKYVSIAENEADIEQILADSTVFMTDHDTLYVNGRKTSYTSDGYNYFKRNRVLYVSADCALSALGCTAEELKDYVVVEDGISYVPILQTAKNLGKYTYEDSRGWICVSDEELNLSNSIETNTATETSDIIDRFLQFERPSGDEIYNSIISNGMYRKHPRIFVKESDVTKLKSDIKSNSFKKKAAEATFYMADSIVEDDVVAYEKAQNGTIFHPCLEVRNNLITLTTAYMITDDAQKKQAYFDRIWAEVYNSCVNWPDWNVSNHYLDMGKISVGIALAYDVCYNDFTNEKRELIRKSLSDKILYYAQSTYAGNTVQYGNAKSTNNWGAVCNGGLLLLCLATMDEEDVDSEYTSLTKHIASEALQALEWPITATYPGGAWSEGLGYFEYVVEYLSWSANALTNSCGTDFGIMDYPGVYNMPIYALYIQTIKNGYFNYADGATEVETASTPPEVFLMAKLKNDIELNDMYYDFKYNLLNTSVYNGRAVRDLLFYTVGDSSEVRSSYPLDSTFGGVEISVMKSGWEQDDTYMAAVGGQINSHFDKGSFIFESQGERWAIDLGKDDYNLEGGYVGELGYDIYRKRAEGHNTLVFNPGEDAGQIYGETAVILDTAYGENEAYTIYDLSRVYAGDCTDVKRGFFLGDSRNTLTIQDEFTLKTNNSDVYWFMHTKADITVSQDGKTAILNKNGKSLKVEFLTNLTDWKVEAVPAEPLEVVREGQAENIGITKIRFTGKGSDKCYIVAKLTPLIDGETYSPISYLPITEWKVDEYEAEISNVKLDKSNGNLDVSFDVRSRSGKSFKMLIASYNSGELLGLSEILLEADMHMSSMIIENISIFPQATYIKCMFWEDNDNLVPLIGSVDSSY